MASSGSVSITEEQNAHINAQNAKALEAGVKASLKRRSTDSEDDVERAPRGSPVAAAATPLPSPRGQTRDAENDADDEERLNRSTSVVPKVLKGQNKKTLSRTTRQGRKTGLTTCQASLGIRGPYVIHHGGRIDKANLSWKHVGSVVLARTFARSMRLVARTRGGPQLAR